MMMMPLPDVLDHWRPTIVWGLFNQGPISDPAWACFKQIVELCHAVRHWDEDLQSRRLSPPRHYEFPPESKLEYRRRRDQWQSDIHQSQTHLNRALFLADQTVVALSYSGTNAEAVKGTADWKLWFASKGAVRYFAQALAFESFNADQELGDEPDHILLRWLRNAGKEFPNTAT